MAQQKGIKLYRTINILYTNKIYMAQHKDFRATKSDKII